MLLTCNYGSSFKHMADGGIHQKEAAVENND
jgi:hypothetical protein